ncbi:hypothetical protein HELRODRAFT_182905 [Helobdella robusta]|uniref:Uncharacterized protein n=1 Tax=Helobdella robusta TaxID=6412 RepID=T1FIW9_HELRO|nr:hypothetical protein HELRODRAFT_182905 [Helobdella robusta]ESN90002.1 hypothetical protein HELRODRAFT_182905 [Helobdella robusta]
MNSAREENEKEIDRQTRKCYRKKQEKLSKVRKRIKKWKEKKLKSVKETRKNRCRMHEILFIAKKYSLLSPDLILIFLQIPEVLRSMGPRTSIQIGKNSIEGRAPSYFLIFSSDARVAAKPLSLLPQQPRQPQQPQSSC